MENAYFAGLFDGEGCIRINRWEKPNSSHIRYNLFCTIGLSNRPAIDALNVRFPGHVGMNRHDLRGPNNRVLFVWTIGSRKAANFLKAIRPYTIIKSDEIDVALKLQDHISSTPYVRTGRRGVPRAGFEEIREYRESLYLEIAQLKKRSFPLLLPSGA